MACGRHIATIVYCFIPKQSLNETVHAKKKRIKHSAMVLSDEIFIDLSKLYIFYKINHNNAVVRLWHFINRSVEELKFLKNDLCFDQVWK